MRHCKDCTDRYPGCHDHCEKYKEDQAEYDKIKAAMKDEMDYKKYAVTRSFQRRDDDVMRKKKHAGYRKFKGHH